MTLWLAVPHIGAWGWGNASQTENEAVGLIDAVTATMGGRSAEIGGSRRLEEEVRWTGLDEPE